MPSSTFNSQPSSVTIQQAQLAMNDVPEFAGSVKAIRTDVLVDKAAEELYPGWEKNQEQWKLVGGDHAYHYYGSAIWFTRIGHAMAEAMFPYLEAANHKGSSSTDEERNFRSKEGN